MTDLILPSRELIVPSRRAFMGGVLTSIIAGPMIVRASSLMDINTLQNRLIVAFRDKYNIHHADLYPSLLNFSSILNPSVLKWWEDQHGTLAYSLVRRGTIPPERQEWYGGPSRSGTNWTPERIKLEQRMLARRYERHEEMMLRREELTPQVFKLT